MPDEINMLGGAIVMVSNQQRALEFYSEKLGFEIKENIEDGKGKWIEVRPKNSGAPISLVDPNIAEMPTEKRKQALQKIGTPTGIWFYAKNINLVYETLKSRGVEITVPEKQPWGVFMSRFYDQDKNEYSLLENPELIF